MYFSAIGLSAIVILSAITLIATAGLLAVFKSKAASNSVNDTNLGNVSANGKINVAKNFKVIAKYIKVEKIKENNQGQKKERYRNIKRNIEGKIRKHDTPCKKDADKKLKILVQNLLKYDSKNIKDYKDIKDLECEFVSNF